MILYHTTGLWPLVGTAGLAPMWVVHFATFAPLDEIEALTVVYSAQNERQAAGLVARWRAAGREVIPLKASSEERAAA